MARTNRTPTGRRVLALLSASYAVSFVDRALVAVAGAPIKHDLHLTDAQFGSLQGLAFALLYCLGGLPLGWLADRTDRRRLIAAGLVFWSLMTAACGLASSFPVFFLARVGVGLGEACLLPAGLSLLAATIPKPRMGQAVGIFLVGSTVGNILALLAGGQLLLWLGRHGGLGAMHTPWRILFLLACPPGLVMAALVLSIAEPKRAAALPSPGVSEALSHLRPRAGAYGWLAAATACTMTLAQAQAAWIPQLYVRRFGLTPGEAALSVGWMVLLSAPLGQWAGGALIDRLARRGVKAAPHLVLAACSALCLPPALVFCTATDLRVSQAAYVVFNALAFATTPSGLSGLQTLAPDRVRGVVIALMAALVTLVGVGLGPLAVGALTDLVFHDEQALGPALLTVIGVAGAGGCLLALAGRTAFARAAD